MEIFCAKTAVLTRLAPDLEVGNFGGTGRRPRPAAQSAQNCTIIFSHAESPGRDGLSSTEYEWRWAEMLADHCARRALVDLFPPDRDDEPPFELDDDTPAPPWNGFLRWAMDIGRREGEWLRSTGGAR
jgi:hypothetical protein